MRLLFAEDDPMIGAGVRQGLAQEGFAVDWVRDGAAAEAALAESVHEIVLLDLGLPRKEGLDVLAAMRRRGDARPGAILSRAQLEEKLYGWKDAVDSNAVEVHLSSLRRKLGSGWIRNVRGLGWMIARPPTAGPHA